MKTNKRFLAAMTASLLALTPMAATSMLIANAEDCTITVNNSAKDYEYTAYKIFKGDKSGTDPNYTLSNLKWADGFDYTSFISDLKSDTTFGTTFSGVTDAESVAAALDTIKTDNNKLAQFAKLAFANKGTTTSYESTYNSTTGYTIPATEAGYYLVEESSVPTGAVTSRYMLKVAGTTSVEPKRPSPSLTKEIVGPNANADKDANTASVGDAVEYKLNSAVPDMTGYNKYFFVVNDTMEPGLTFNPDSVAVKIGNTDLTNKAKAGAGVNTTFEVQTGDAASGKTFQIVFNNFIQYNTTDYINKPIEITYNATVNNAATAGSAKDDANENTVNLTYSNNPNVNSNGGTAGEPDGPDEPGGTDPKGETTPDKTYTYLTELEIEKVDKANHDTKLKGAKFELTGESLQAVYHEQGIFKVAADANPAYYLLTDGTYSKDAPTTETADKYVNGMAAVKYALVTDSDTISTMNKVTAFGESGTDGKVTFGKIGVGTYKIVETKEPTGYNKLTKPVVITITAEPSATGCEWKYSRDGGTAASLNSFMIENAQGSTLPSTGGIGTKMFYLFGSAFVIGASTFIVTKKRVGENK